MSLPESGPGPYPDPVYDGSGEVSATYRPDGAPHDLGAAPGNRVDYLATSASTEGSFGLYRWNFGVHVSGPDPHFHRTLSESFYVLSGTVKIYDGTRWVDTSAGATKEMTEEEKAAFYLRHDNHWL